MAKSLNKNQKKRLVTKGKGIAKKSNDKCFIFNKTEHLAKDNKGKQGNPVKKIAQTSIITID